MEIIDNRNHTLAVDFYELTMMNSYFKLGMQNKQVVYDVFYRNNPDNGGYSIFCGLESIIKYIQNLKFTESDINYLRSKKMFDEDFLQYLKNYKFTSSIYSMEEGQVMFPHEPIVTVVGNIMDAQLIETVMLNFVNHQSLIATKASRIKQAAGNRTVMEFGARRAHGIDAAEYGSRAAYIGGADAVAIASAEIKFGIKAVGTIAHAYVQAFGNDYDACMNLAKTYPNNVSYLLDTYDVINSGVPAVIKVNNEFLKPIGEYVKSVRLDSGDLAYLSKKVRKMLDEAGMQDTKIVVSNSLDEYTIEDLIRQKAPIDNFGIGEKLITSKSCPIFGAVYKLAEFEGKPRIKVSENTEKITNPGHKKVYRLYDKESKKAIADVITKYDEKIDSSKPYEIFDPVYIWKKQVVENYEVKELQVPIFENGKLVYEMPSIEEIKRNKEIQKETLYDEITRFMNPHKYYVDLSKDLWFTKQELLQKAKSKK